MINVNPTKFELNKTKLGCDWTGQVEQSPSKVQAAIMNISHRATKKLQFYVIVILPRELNYNPQFKHVILQKDIWDFLARHCYTRFRLLVSLSLTVVLESRTKTVLISLSLVKYNSVKIGQFIILN